MHTAAFTTTLTQPDTQARTPFPTWQRGLVEGAIRHWLTAVPLPTLSETGAGLAPCSPPNDPREDHR
jgi:hypothetical protein